MGHQSKNITNKLYAEQITTPSPRTINSKLVLLLTSISLIALGAKEVAANQDQEITEILVVSERDEDKTKISKGTEALLKTPGNFGDPLQALISLPGITFGGSDLDEPVVRGSGPGDNLFLIDDMEVGYLFHKLSDSIMSKNVVHSFDFKAAAFGAEYGNATGGVIDVSLRDPNGDSFKGNVDIGMLKSGFLLEGGLSDRISFYTAARYNTAHWFMTRFEEQGDGTTYKMPKSHDYTARFKWQGETSSLTFTAIGAKDIEQNAQDPGVVSAIPLGNKLVESFSTLGVRYEKSFENGGVFATTLSRTTSKARDEFEGTRFTDLRKTGYHARSHYSQSFGKHDIRLGLNYSTVKTTHDFDAVLGYCNTFDSWCLYSNYGRDTRKATLKQTELYIKDNFNISDTIRLDLGVQASKDHYLDQTFIEPRVGIHWDATENSQFYARYGRYHQRPATDELLSLRRTRKSQQNEKATHYLVGNRWQIADGWFVRTEAYYKDIYTSSYLGTSIERKIDGKAYGGELLIAKQVMEEGLYGWLAVSYGKSERQDKATGEKVDYRYSTPFSSTLALSYNFGSGWNFGVKWRLQSGDTYTPVENISLRPPREDGILHNIANQYIYTFGKPNSERSKMYNRLDVRLEKQSQYSFGNITYYIDIVNVLGRENLSNLQFPARLIRPNDAGGFQTHPETDTNIPFFAAIGVNLAF